jgi:iron complex outermembrane receptor protein
MARQGIPASGRRLLNSASLAALAYAALSGATVAGATLWAGSAAAQAAAAGTANVDEVIVTGFRDSLAKALNLKRVETAEVDTILAEDIGKFPDLNLAESLQRIPGVSITREGGEGRQITVRGLGPQYTRVRINGMEALSTTGAPDNDGGVNRTRAFDFDVFSSDLFNSISTRKTAEANVDEGALGATVDLNSAKPFDYNKFTFIAAAKDDYNTLAKTSNPRLSALIADVSSDGQFGVLASLSYTKRDFIDVGSSTVRWDQGNVLSTGGTTAAPLVGFGSVAGTNCQVFPLPAPCATADSALHPRFPRYDDYTDSQSRLGASLSFQWKPNDKNLMSVDALYSDYRGARQEQYLEAPGFSGTGKCASPTTCTSIANIAVLSDTINSQGVMTAGTFNGVDTRVEDRFDKLQTKFQQYTFNGSHQLTDKLSVDELIGYSTSDFSNPVQTTLGFDQFNVQGFSYDFSSRVPMLNFGQANLGANGPWVLTEVRERPQTDDNGYKTVQVNGHYDWDKTWRFSGGVNYKQYDFATTSLRLVNGESVNSTNAYKGLLAVPLSSYSQLVTLPTDGLSVPSGSSLTFLTPSVSQAASALGLYSNTSLFALSTTGDLGDNASVREKDIGGYVEAEFKTELLGKAFRGNLGVRTVQTEENANGFTFVGGVLGPVTADHKYTNTLPSMNLVWDWSDEIVLRASASKMMARPNLTDLVAATSVTVSGTSFSVKTGNPDLRPFLANAYDLALEWYPERGTIVSLAVFRKDITTLVTTSVQNITFHNNPFGIPDSAAVAACGSTPGCGPNVQWAFSSPQNTPGGTVNGFEINYQQPFTMLPGLLSHTGTLLNLTWVDSRVLYPNGSGGFVPDQLLGLSRYSANATLYYEDDKWSARISGAYRSRYLMQVPGKETGTDADGFDQTFNLDASVQYTVNPHLKFTLEGINLTDQYENEFNDTSRDLSYYYHHTGREILAGVRYSY